MLAHTTFLHRRKTYPSQIMLLELKQKLSLELIVTELA